MASAGITALLKKMDYKNVVIAIDGSLFRYEYLSILKFNFLRQNQSWLASSSENHNKLMTN